jgi:hypothetical protein
VPSASSGYILLTDSQWNGHSLFQHPVLQHPKEGAVLPFLTMPIPASATLSTNAGTDPSPIDTPKLFDHQGKSQEKLSANRYDLESITNP